MKKTLVLIIFSLLSYEGICCVTCNRQLQEKIYDSAFFPNLFTMLSAFIVLAVIVVLLTYLSNKKYARLLNANTSSITLNPVPLTTAAMVLGIGIGGFIDGILFHQILQWHEMISNKIPPITLEAKSVNMFWDGIFHTFNLLVVITGLLLLWKLLQHKGIDKSGHLLFGGLLLGWGLFNIVEGIIDHQLLKLHNVRDVISNIDSWNYGFLVVSGIIFGLGYFVVHAKPGKKGILKYA